MSAQKQQMGGGRRQARQGRNEQDADSDNQARAGSPTDRNPPMQLSQRQESEDDSVAFIDESLLTDRDPNDTDADDEALVLDGVSREVDEDDEDQFDAAEVPDDSDEDDENEDDDEEDENEEDENEEDEEEDENEDEDDEADDEDDADDDDEDDAIAPRN